MVPDSGKLLADVLGPDSVDLWVITTFGEAAPRLLYRRAGLAAISPDGQSVAFVGANVGNGRIAQEVFVGGINGEAPRTLATAGEPQSLFAPAWSPDGRWIAYLRVWNDAQDPKASAIEVRSAGGGTAKTLVSRDNLPKSTSPCPSITGGIPECLSWSPDWHLLFSATQTGESPSKLERYSLWEAPVEPRTGETAPKPEQLTQWSDYAPPNLTITADGKRLSFLKTRTWQDVYVAEFGEDGSSLKSPRRFTLDNRGSWPNGWTADSRTILFRSNRNGKSQIFDRL